MAVQIVTDLDYIKAWVTQAETTLRSIEGDEPAVPKDDVISFGEGEEGERRTPHPLQGSFKGPLAFRMTKIGSTKDLPPNSPLISTGASNSSNKVLGRPKEVVLQKRTKPQLLPSRDFRRWTCIAEILTTCTNSERVLTSEELENSPIPDAAKWVALCKR